MKFCEYIRMRLSELGYDTVFGVPGSYIMPVWQSCEEKVKIVLASHECGAAYMADGWSRITRKTGVVFATLGPGITNLVTGVAASYKDSIPLLVITGQAPVNTLGKGAFQECFKVDRGFSPTELLTPITKASFEITNIENAVFLFETALKLANKGRKGPVHLSIPLDIQNEEITFDESCRKNIFESFDNQKKKYYVNNNSLSEVAEELNNAKRPLILTGWGSYLSEAHTEIKVLAEKLVCPIISTIKGLSGVSYSWDMYLGHIGSAEDRNIVSILKEYDPDVVLVLGASLSAYYFEPISKVIDRARYIQVDIEEEQIGIRKNVEIGICNDIKEFLLELNPEVNQTTKRNNSFIEELKNKLYCSKSPIFSKNESQLMARAIYELNKISDKDVVVIPDAGNHWLNTLSLYKPLNVSGFFTNSGLASMGHAIGATIGMSLANRKKRFICVSGDGSVLMCGNEILASVAQGLNNIFIIFNNSSLGRVRIGQLQNFGEKYISTSIDNFNIEQWALSIGAKGRRVDNIDQFISEFNEALTSKETYVIEVICDKDEVPLALIK